MDHNSLRLLLLVAIATASIVGTIQARPFSEACTEPADIIFVLDSSSSIYPVYFHTHVKKFVKDVVLKFNIGPGPKDTRIGAMLFSTQAYLEFHLNTFDNADDVIDAVHDMKFKSGNTYTDRALKFVLDPMMKPENGAREGVAKIVIIITDGQSADTNKTLKAADAIKARGADVFSIGVGHGVYLTELRAMASKPSAQFSFQVDDFQALAKIEGIFSKLTCEAIQMTKPPPSTTTTPTPTTTTSTTTPTTTTPTTITTTTTIPTTTTTTATTTESTTPVPTTTTTTIAPSTLPQDPLKLKRRVTELPQGDAGLSGLVCDSKPADIYFLLDASTSVWVVHFQKRVLPFVRNLVSEFQISPLHTRIGLVTFSNDVNHEFGLNEYTNLKDLLDAIQPDNIDYLTGATNTGDAIRYVTNKGFGAAGHRKDATKIIITVTDGLSQEPLATAEAAAEARYKGVMMFAVGVGKYVDDKEISDISSNPDEDFTFHVDSFQDLGSIVQKLAQKTCQAVTLWSNDLTKKIPECSKKPANVMFVYDSYKPASITTAVLNDLVRTFSLDASIAVPGTQIGVLTQSCYAGGYTSIQSATELSFGLKEVIANLNTQLHVLIKDLRLNIFSNLSARSDRQNIVILVVDDTYGNFHLLEDEVKLLKANGIKVFVVAVGDILQPTIRSLASDPVDENVIRISGYDGLKEKNINVWEMLCGFDKQASYDIDVKYFSQDQGGSPVKTTSAPDMTKTTVRVTKVSILPPKQRDTMRTKATTMMQNKDFTASEVTSEAQSSTEYSAKSTAGYDESPDLLLKNSKISVKTTEAQIPSSSTTLRGSRHIETTETSIETSASGSEVTLTYQTTSPSKETADLDHKMGQSISTVETEMSFTSGHPEFDASSESTTFAPFDFSTDTSVFEEEDEEDDMDDEEDDENDKDGEKFLTTQMADEDSIDHEGEEDDNELYDTYTPSAPLSTELSTSNNRNGVISSSSSSLSTEMENEKETTFDNLDDEFTTTPPSPLLTELDEKKTANDTTADAGATITTTSSLSSTRYNVETDSTKDGLSSTVSSQFSSGLTDALSQISTDNNEMLKAHTAQNEDADVTNTTPYTIPEFSTEGSTIWYDEFITEDDKDATHDGSGDNDDKDSRTRWSDSQSLTFPTYRPQETPVYTLPFLNPV